MPRRSEKARNLTDRFIQTLKPSADGRRIEVPDADTRGLAIRVMPTGTKSWVFRCTPKGLPRRREQIGEYPALSIAEARQRAREIKAAAGRGVDLPAREREQRKAAGNARRTVADLAREFVEQYCKANQRRWKLTERLLEMHVTPEIGTLSLPAVKRENVAALLDDLQNEKRMMAQVNRVRSQLHLMFAWAAERGYIEYNPVATIKRRKIERPRERVLSRDDLRAIWKAAAALQAPSGQLVQAWILTGTRRDEMRTAKWSEIERLDGENPIMTLPAERNKGKRDFELPLSPAMVQLLESLPRSGEFIFSVDGKRPYAGTRGLKAIIDRTAKVKDWVFHDLRRTVRSGLAEIGIAEEIAERVLNHAQRGLDRVYNRHQYLEEKRAALNGWAERVALMVGEGRSAPNVVELRPSA